MAQKVFKIPDGEGGWKFQIQTLDGEWIDTDGSGNPIPQEGMSHVHPEEVQDTLSPAPVKKRRGRKPKPQDASQRTDVVNLCIQLSRRDYRLISTYVHWRSLEKEECHRNKVMVAATMEWIRRDREFKEFLLRNPGIESQP